ncbi:MAG: 50S ribosomal protein L23 [Chloroflexi bacterium]|nr:50S ribosomal protein L23 [Chloroflexota bacterium]
MHVYEVLRRPVVTEKSTLLQGQSKYVFEVATAANKAQIKEAVEKAFNVKVLAVNVSKVHGKIRRMGRTSGRTPDWKKAVVTLRPEDKIEVFEGV